MVNKPTHGQTRNDLLADIADMYYLQGQNQSEIAKKVGVTRSMISRMLTEARDLGIVQIRIERPIRYDRRLGKALVDKFGLLEADVIIERPGEALRKQLGFAGARVLIDILKPGMTLGLPWGTTVNAVVEAVEVDQPVPVQIAQLVGAFGARNQDYDGHGLVQRLTEKLGGEGFFLNAPFFSEDEETAQALLMNKGVRESLQVAENCDVALLGVGSTNKDFSSFYNAGYMDDENFQQLIDEEAVGDVCGLHFDIQGQPRALEFERRIVTVGRERLLQIPRRIGIAGGVGKVDAIIGAVRSGYINQLVTNSVTVQALLDES